MRRNTFTVGLVGTLATALIVSSCTADQVLYGPPGALKAQTVPPAAGASSSLPAGDAGSTDLAGICTTAAAPAVPSGCDPAAWQTVVYPMILGWGCAQVGCHNAGGTAPTIYDDKTDGYKTTWSSLVNFTSTGSKRYVDPCSLDPNASAISCNVKFLNPSGSAGGTCGSAMPKGGAALPAADRDTLEKWLKCGARI